MKKTITVMAFLSLLVFPSVLRALTNEQREGESEICQGWVDRHNEKLSPVVLQAVKTLKMPKHSFRAPSIRARLISLKRIHGKAIAKNNIPMEAKAEDGTEVPLVAVYQSEAAGLSFLTADYADELDNLHSSTDIYMKIGLVYRFLFHGEGYRGCARLVSLGQNLSPFFEVDTYKGGTSCDKTIYTLDAPAVKAMKDDLYDHPEGIDPQKYVQEVLDFSVWAEGFTLYEDADKDGSLEIVNGTDAEYPRDLREKLNEKYGLKGADFAGAFRKTVSVFKWDAAKLKFQDLGDYYY